MNGCKYCVLLVFNAVILAIVLCVAVASYHDNAVTRRRCDTMGERIAEMLREQERQNASIRQIKTDSAIAFRIATRGEFVKE